VILHIKAVILLSQSEARVASVLGKGYYTIGPCGEELLGMLSLNLQPHDLTALHYRHLATSITKQLLHTPRTIDEIILDRARGYTCSIHDPVTGGRHCSIGGTMETEFLVTSTLASQVPPAVGRALAIPLSHRLLTKNQCQFASNAISVTSIGDGSLNNAHTLSGLNLARYATHNQIKCPFVLIITDNNICISLKGTGYTAKFINHLSSTMKVEIVNGQDSLALYDTSQQLFDYTRMTQRPAVLYIHNLPRRFGHAATDRQFAYYTYQQIQEQLQQHPLADTISLFQQLGSNIIYHSFDEIIDLFNDLTLKIERAFDQASLEPKISDRHSLEASSITWPSISTNSSNSQPLIVYPFDKSQFDYRKQNHSSSDTITNTQTPTPLKDVMRKNMTKVYHELFANNSKLIYLGEDVQHGGYYVVTEGLVEKYPMRIRDFPPDETSLIGAAMGFAQSGLTVICEIPYAKYLDCASDIFAEAVIMHWLSQGKQVNPMLLRLQGFDKGIFGGNFHTHNMLTFLPGLEIFAFSNGYDYARGIRYLIRCVEEEKKVVMSVDSTDVLNRRHLIDVEKDEFFLCDYPPTTTTPTETTEMYHKDQVIIYKHRSSTDHTTMMTSKKPILVIVSYANGIPTSLSAAKVIATQMDDYYEEIQVVDTPYLSHTPQQLINHIQTLLHTTSSSETTVAIAPIHMIFADVCKYNANMPMALRAMDLQAKGLLQQCLDWRVIGAVNTYNPLGTYLTFTSVEDILETVTALKKESA
jgi:2-oxoisovalerate dehydrogenase E1 component